MATASGIPSTCTCDPSTPTIEGYWQSTTGLDGPWGNLDLGIGGSAIDQVEANLGQNGVATFTFTLRLTCASSSGPVSVCTRSAIRVRRDGNSTNLMAASTTPTTPDPCSTTPVLL
jgi:hypothetical protein